MRINRYVALATGMSRRAADKLIEAGKILLNGGPATSGQIVSAPDIVMLNGKKLVPPQNTTTILLHKPVGYVCSRNGQGSRTIYELLPPELHNLKPVGRLDKYSSGLLLLTNDGTLAHELTHPSFRKMKCYEITLDKPLAPQHWEQITKLGVTLEDGLSKFELHWLDKNNGLKWIITIYEGRNRQIRRTFATLGYTVTKLHRTHFGGYTLGALAPSRWQSLT